MLKATKSLTYGTRRLKAGDTIPVRSRADARVLIALGRATRVSDDGSPTPAKSPAPKSTAKSGRSPASQSADELAALRKAYHDKFGKKPFNGWDAATLRDKVAAA